MDDNLEHLDQNALRNLIEYSRREAMKLDDPTCAYLLEMAALSLADDAKSPRSGARPNRG